METTVKNSRIQIGMRSTQTRTWIERVCCFFASLTTPRVLRSQFSLEKQRIGVLLGQLYNRKLLSACGRSLLFIEPSLSFMANSRHSFCCWLLIATIFVSVVQAQPSPQVQQRIDKAIKDAANKTNLDYTAFVNPFIGTGLTYGDVWWGSLTCANPVATNFLSQSWRISAFRDGTRNSKLRKQGVN